MYIFLISDKSSWRTFLSEHELSQSKQTNKANELANKAITKAGKEMKGFVKNLFGSDKKEAKAEQTKKSEQKLMEANKTTEHQKFVKPGNNLVIERTFIKPESDNVTSSGQDKKGDVTMMKMIQQRLKTKPKPSASRTDSDQQSTKQLNKQTKTDLKRAEKESKNSDKQAQREPKEHLKAENSAPDAKRRASKSYIDSFLPAHQSNQNKTSEMAPIKTPEQIINQEIQRNG